MTMTTKRLYCYEQLMQLCHNSRDYAVRLHRAMKDLASKRARAAGALTYTRIAVSDNVDAYGKVEYTPGKSQFNGGRRWKTIRHAECVVTVNPKAFALKHWGSLL